MTFRRLLVRGDRVFSRKQEQDALFALDEEARATFLKSRRRRIKDSVGLKFWYDTLAGRASRNRMHFVHLEKGVADGSVAQTDLDICRQDVDNDIDHFAVATDEHRFKIVDNWKKAAKEALHNIRCMCGSCGHRAPSLRSYDVDVPINDYDADHWLIVSDLGRKYYDEMDQIDITLYAGTPSTYKPIVVPKTAFRHVYKYTGAGSTSEPTLFHLKPETVSMNKYGLPQTVLCVRCYRAHTKVSARCVFEYITESFRKHDDKDEEESDVVVMRRRLKSRGWLQAAERLRASYSNRQEKPGDAKSSDSSRPSSTKTTTMRTASSNVKTAHARLRR